MGPVPNVVGCPKGLLKDLRAAFVGVLALGVEVPTALGSTAVTALGSRAGSLMTSVIVETAPGVMPALFSHHHRTAPCSGPDTR